MLKSLIVIVAAFTLALADNPGLYQQASKIHGQNTTLI